MQVSCILLVCTLFLRSFGTEFRLHFDFCNQAPNPALQTICSNLHKWDLLVRHRSTSTSTVTRTWSAWRTSRVWSSSRSRWSAGPQNWSGWTSWTLNTPSTWPRDYRVQTIVNETTTHGDQSTNEPKRMAFEIQYEISSANLPGQSGNGRTRIKTGDRLPIGHSLPMPPSQQWPLGPSGGFKDLYSPEQHMVGPPGHRRPNVLVQHPTHTTHPPKSLDHVQVTGPPATMSTKQVKTTVTTHPIDSNSGNGRQAQQGGSKLNSLRNENALDCMDLNCICTLMNGRLASSGCELPSGRRLSKAIRKEYRQLNITERNRFHSAMNQLKQTSGYNRMVRWYTSPEASGGAHSGPAFLPWHREFIKRFEIALRLIDETVSLPYWDSTLDSRIPDPTETCLFTEQLAGETNNRGEIINGFAHTWRTERGQKLIRRLGGQGKPLSDQDISAIMKHKDITGIMAYTAPQQGCRYPLDWSSIEYSHANVLVWIGGGLPHETSNADDPLFFLHHAFVDSIWEEWRIRQQSYMTRASSYPADLPECSSIDHFANSTMRPFGSMLNIDGVSNDYTANLYQYSTRPSCSNRDEQCASEFLFCDRSHGQPRCASKIRHNGNCTGYSRGENPCFKGICRSGRCENIQKDEVIVRVRSINEPSEAELAEVDKCFNAHECCSVWFGEGQCTSNAKYMSEWCTASCQLCVPNYNLDDECADRHPSCEWWSSKGECSSSPIWMAENCRQSCDRCELKRSKICAK